MTNGGSPTEGLCWRFQVTRPLDMWLGWHMTLLNKSRSWLHVLLLLLTTMAVKFWIPKELEPCA